MYETETQYSYKEYKKMQNILFMRRACPAVIILIVAALIILSSSNIYCYIGYAIIVGIVVISLFVSRLVRIKKGWHLGSKTDTVIAKYNFLDDHFEEELEGKKSYTYYKDIHRIIETANYMYITTSIYRAYIIKKDKCSNELLQRIRKYKQFI